MAETKIDIASESKVLERNTIRPQRSGLTSVYQRLPSPPRRKGFLQNILTFCYNKDAGTYFTRTPLSWLGILMFYIILYAVLIALGYLSVQLILLRLEKDKPRYIGEDSLLKAPGLAVYPALPSQAMMSSIKWNQALRTWEDIPDSHRMEKFFRDYEAKDPSNAVVCNFTYVRKEKEVCKVNKNDWGKCILKNGKIQSPCLYFTTSKVYNWKPESYDLASIPQYVPEELKEMMRKTPEGQATGSWLFCKAFREGDKRRFTNFQYYPSNLFPSYFYPWKGQKNYRSPVVAVNVGNITSEQKFTMDCKIWAKNLPRKSKNFYGTLKFTIEMKP